MLQCRDFVTSLGEKCGPLVTMEIVRRLTQNLPDDKNSNSDFKAALDEYLSDFPGPESPEVAKVLAEFDELVPEALAAREKAEEQRAIAKKEKAAAIEQRIREMLMAEESLGPWAEVEGDSFIARRLLTPFQKAPSKATKKMMKQTVAEICQSFALIPHSFAELSFLRTPSLSRFERYLADYVEDMGVSKMVGNMSRLELAMVHVVLLREALVFRHASGLGHESCLLGGLHAFIKVAKEEITSQLFSKGDYDAFAKEFYERKSYRDSQ